MMNNRAIVRKALPYIVIFTIALVYGLYTYIQGNTKQIKANSQEIFAQITPARTPVTKGSSWLWTLLMIRDSNNSANTSAKYIVNWCGQSSGNSGESTNSACSPSGTSPDFISELKSEFISLNGKSVTTNIQHESVDCGRVVVEVESEGTTLQINSFDTGKNCPKSAQRTVNALGQTDNAASINSDSEGDPADFFTKISELLGSFDVDIDNPDEALSVTPGPVPPSQRHLCRADEPQGKRLRGEPNYCDDACCGADGECPNGQKCSIANGECQTNSSCDPNSGTVPPGGGEPVSGDITQVQNLMTNILTYCKDPNPQIQNLGLINSSNVGCVDRFQNVNQATMSIIKQSVKTYGAFQCVGKVKADTASVNPSDTLLSHFTGEATARSFLYSPPSGYTRHYFQPGQKLSGSNIKPGDIMVFDYRKESAGHIMYVIKVQSNSIGDVDVITVNEANTVIKGDVRNSSYPLSLIYNNIAQGKWRAAGWLSKR